MNARRFQPGGTLREDALYAERDADRELLAALTEGETCAVLAPRQIGKSSLRVRTARKLRERGLRVATVDLTRIGGRHTEVSGWYFGLVQELASRLDLDEDPATFWSRHANTTPLHRFVIYLRKCVLEAIDGPVVVFFDEIDSVLALPFAVDDFFAALRDTYNARADDAAYRRLSLCLMGVATPSDLAREPARTPFNVGRSIRLEDFSRAEADALLPGLTALDPARAERWLDAIYGWTAGHPYMMQKICAKLVEGERDVDHAVAEMFLRHGRGEDANLEYAERRLLADPRATQMLRLYRRLLEGERVAVEREDPTQHALRLTGMGSEDRTTAPASMRVRNRIYGAVFDGAWVRETETARLLTEPLNRWIASGQNDDFVLRGQALDDAQAWAKERTDLSTAETRFLMAGLQVARREETARSEAERETERRKQVERAARSLRRNLAILSGLVVLLVIALGVAVFQYREAKRAQHAAEAATRRERGVMAQALSQQVGQEIPALHAGIEAVAPALAAGERPPAASVSGLAAALFAAAYSRRVDLPAGSFNATDISPDGRRIVAAMNDKKLRTWVTPDTAPPLVVEAVIGLGQAPRFTRDGGAILAPLDGGELRAWSVATGDREQIRTVPSGSALDVATIDGETPRVLTLEGGALASVDLGDPATSRALAAGAPVKHAVLSPDGSRACAVRTDHDIAVVDASNGALVARLAGLGAEPRGCAFSGDGRFVVTTVGASVLRWSVPDDPVAADAPAVVAERHVEADEANADLQAAALSPDGSLVAFSGRSAVLVWEVGSGRVERRLAAPFVTALAFSEDGAWIAGGRRDGRIELVEPRPAGRSWSFRAHGKMILAVAFSPDGRQLMTASVDRSVRIFPVEAVSPAIVTTTEAAPISCVGLAPDGVRVVHGGAPGELVVRDVRDGRELVRLVGHGGRVDRCRFSPDGLRIVTASADRTIREWDAATGQAQRTIDVPASAADVVYAPDGRRIAASFVEGPVTLRLWELQTQAVVGELPVPSRLPGTVRFSVDGARLFVGGPDGNVAIFDPSAARIERLLANGATTSTVATSSDGRRILTTCADATAHVWDAASGEETLVLRGRTPAERPLRFTGDGSRVHFRGVLDPLPATPEGLLAAACALLDRERELDPVRASCAPHLSAD